MSVAVDFEDQRLTYRELNSRANQLAHHLRALGIGPDVAVAICMERSIEMLIGLLAVLKAGGIYVPMDPSYPPERRAFMLRDANVKVVLTQSALARRFPNHQSQVVCLDTDWAGFTGQSTANPADQTAPEGPAYIIYTSGSTGQPKGVLVSGRAIAGHCVDIQRYYELDGNDRVLQFAALSFDASIEQILPTWISGARLVLRGPAVWSPTELLHKIIASEVTVMDLPTAYWHLVAHAWADGQPAVSDPKLRLVIVGGEAMSPSAARLWQQIRFNKGRLLNAYGPTEATITAALFEVARDFSCETQAPTLPIGRPLGKRQIYVLDGQGKPLPSGTAGELHIGGPGLATGYLHQIELTQEKFIADPFSQEPAARMYKTGDLGRYLPDGNIEFLGRVDDQVKIRGYRIELREIEAALARHSSVKDAVVLAREDIPGDKRLVAYVVLRDATAMPTSELGNFLRQRLPQYMVPAAFALLESLPLTANGKVDRKALPAPSHERPELATGYVAPRNSAEASLARVWSEVLGLDRIGVHDDFFLLGGDSLRAIQIVARLRAIWHRDVPLGEIFAHPTIGALAQALESHRDAIETDPAGPIQPVSREELLPLSYSQERAWFMQKLYPANFAYNSQCLFYLSGSVDVGALERSLTEMVRRHEILRTTFPELQGQPIQRIHEPYAVSLPIVDLQELAPDKRELALQQRVAAETQRPFDLTKLPLIRWRLVQLESTEYVLIFVENHLVHDGWSSNVFRHELLEIYKAFAAGGASPLAEPTLQFADYAHWQRQWMAGQAAQRQLDYWRRQLAGIQPALALATDFPRPPQPSFRGAASFFDISRDLDGALRALSRQQGATLFMTMFAAFAALLHRYTGQEDICLGTGVANRRWQESEGLIGMLVNNVVLRTQLAGDPTFAELLAQVRSVALGAYANEDTPFDQVVRALEIPRDSGRNPIVQIMFSFHDSPLHETTLPAVRFRCVEAISNQSAKFDMNLIVIPNTQPSVGGRGAETAATLLWEYSNDLFESATIERMASHYLRLLREIAADPAKRLSQIDLLSESESAALVRDFNATARPYPSRQCIQELFAAQAEKTPQAVALICDDQQLSYAELNQRANRLARHLQKQGVGADTVVGICMERSVDLIVGLLAILKAGAAYLPLDPDYPQERLDFMLDDAQVKVLLTQEKFAAGFTAPDRCQPRTMLCLDGDGDNWAAESGGNLPCQVTPDSLAYVIYTSGSTGQPKGVEVRHRGVARLLFGVDYAQLDAHQTFLHLASIAFDAAIFEIWGALLHGAKCVLYPGTLPSSQELGTVLKRHRVTTVWLTAALFNLVVNQDAHALSEVKQLLIGGEALSVPHVRKALSLLPNTQIVNGYGPTESTTFTCCYPIPRQLDENASSVPIGRPIGNTRVHILDDHLNPVPIGVPGEIHIGGDGLARGYLKRPELTEEKFIADPFSAGEKLYKTGDLARYLADGNIEFLGRIDNQVKLRGYRIELGEIEAVIAQHRAVQQAVVLLREDTPGAKRLVAYFVSSGSSAPSALDLRAHTQQKLPDYMIPAVFVSLDSLPLTANGKLDRKALTAHTGQSLSAACQYIAPRDAYESALCKLWAEALQVDKVGIDDDFFALGGHSLLAAKLFPRMDEELGRGLPLSVLFAAPNIRALAEHYRSAAAHKMSSLVALRSQGDRPALFAIPGVFGNVLGYADLAQALGPDQPFYGLQSLGLDGTTAPLDSIAAMARLYIDELRSVQRTGPYALIGACFGASVAYEMTQQLLRAGESVAFLGLLDPTGREGGNADDETSSPRALKMAGALSDLVASRLHLYLDELCQLNTRERIKFIATKLRAVGRSLAQRNRLKGVQREINQIAVYKANLRALDRYKKTPLSGALLALEIFATGGRQQTENWAMLCPGSLAFHQVSGKDSGDMISAQNCRKLAPLLARRLAVAFAQLPADLPAHAPAELANLTG